MNKKIECITLFNVKNYGSVLQSLATKDKFLEYGFETEFINYCRPDLKDKNLMNTWCGKNLIKRIFFAPTLFRWKKVFNGYINRNLKVTEKEFENDNDFDGFDWGTDIFCTGSDQVWNDGWNNGFIPYYFLNFCPENSFKFSYSSSFGKTDLDAEYILQTKELLKEYSFLSVREGYSVRLLEEKYGLFGTNIVDPTLAMDRDYWLKKSKPKKGIKGDYILIYNLNKSKEFDRFCNKFAKSKRMKMFRLCFRYDQIIRCGRSILIPEIEEFIYLFANAKYVITDSFHATAFSLNLNTIPVCIYPREYGGRIEHILKLTNCENCHVSNFSTFDFDVVVDFDNVNRVLKNERKRVDDFLQGVFQTYEKRDL